MIHDASSRQEFSGQISSRQVSPEQISYSDAEQQLLALLQALEANPLDQETGRPATFDKDCLRRHGRLFFQDELLDWEEAFERLLGTGHLKRQGSAFSLTGRSRESAERFRKRFTGDRFGRLQVRCEVSPAYGELSRRVFLGEHRPFSLLDRGQLELVSKLLAVQPGLKALDLGCGIGTVTEALQRGTGARFFGLDLAEPAISRAQERARGNDFLDFCCIDLETLASGTKSETSSEVRKRPWEEPWDRLVGIDALYFLRDPASTLSQLLPTAKPGARMVLAASDLAEGDHHLLRGEDTRLGKILTALDLKFETVDVRHLEHGIWLRQEKAARDLMPTFREEGSEDLGRLALQEAERCLPWFAEGRARRFLYRVDLP